MPLTTTRHLLRTLGALTLERLDDGVVVQRGGKPLALLAYLVATGRRPIARATIADLLWGDESPESARASLRQAIHALRRLLGDEAIGGDRQVIVLAPDAVDSDHARFTAASAAGDADAMVEAYRGPFCDGLELREAPGFDRWAEAERERLRRLMLAVATRAVAARSTAGDLRGAAQLSCCVRAAEPGDDEAVSLCADACIAHGDFDRARETLEQFRARQLADGEPVLPSVESRLARLMRLQRTPTPPSVEVGRPGALDLALPFVAREAALAALFRGLETARAGRTTRQVLVGPVGIGKTRLLDEFEARVRPRGARIARVRFLPAMRRIPGSALVEFARALAALPGALGVGETSASVLVALLPELRAQFPSAPPLAIAHDELPRARATAIADLVAAVSEDRLTVLLRDDDQEMDPASRAVLDGAFTRADLRLLDVRASRTALADASGAEVVDLPPLDEGEVRRLLEGVGRLPDAPWVAPVVRVLRSGSAGNPQLLLMRLRALGVRGSLRLDGAEWSAPDPFALSRDAAAAPELDAMVGALTPVMRLALQLLAQWRRPLPEPDALALIGGAREAPAAGDARAALGELEARGLVVAREEGWAVAHGTVAEACLAAQSRAEAEELQLLLVRYWRARRALSVPVLEHLALICGARGSLLTAAALAREAAQDGGLREVGLHGRALALRIAIAAGHPEWERDLFEAIGWRDRRPRRRLLALGTLVGGILGFASWLAWMLWPRLVVESQPMAEGIGTVAGAATMVVQPRVTVRNGFGQRLTGFGGSVRVRSTDHVLAGDTVITLEEGRAQFRRLALSGVAAGASADAAGPTLVFSSPFARSARVEVTGAWGAVSDAFRVVSLVVNGATVAPGEAARVRAGDTLEIALTFEYTTQQPTANYVVGAAPTWMPHAGSTIRLAGLPRPVREAWQTVYFRVAAPARGSGHIVVLMGAEDSVDHLFSQTAWTVGAPIWDDGNDAQDLPPEKLEELRRTGRTTASRLVRGYPGLQSDLRLGDRVVARPLDQVSRSETVPLMGTAITVEVVDR